MEKLKEIVEKYDYTGINACLFNRDKILDTVSLGFQDLENQIPLDIHHIFRIASISKVIVALGIMKLVEEKRLELDEDISKYLGYQVRNPYFPQKKITIKQLMTQTSSISDGALDDKGYDGVNGPKMNVNLKDLLTNPNYKYYTPKTFLNHEPGSYFEYSNFGCGILACIIESITKEYFTDYIRRILLLPLGMDASFRVEDIINKNRIVSLYTYENQEPKLTRNLNKFLDAQFPRYELGNNFRGPAGGLFISILDLTKIAMMLMNKGKYQNLTLFKESTIDLMEKEAWRGDGHELTYRAKGLQLNLLDVDFWPYKGSKGLKGHFGSAYGALTFMFYTKDFGMIFFCSGTDCGKYDDDIEQIEEDAMKCMINEWQTKYDPDRKLLSNKTVQIIKDFIKDRDWEQFHTGENLTKSLVIEASELLELYQWGHEVKNIEDLKDELADVFVYAIDILNHYDLNLDEIIQNKMKKNALKYPVEKAFGNSNKYNKLK